MGRLLLGTEGTFWLVQHRPVKSKGKNLAVFVLKFVSGLPKIYRVSKIKFQNNFDENSKHLARGITLNVLRIIQFSLSF
jgi:hypothetical protein